MKAILIGYNPDQHQKLKEQGYEVTSVDPKPQSNYYWVEGAEAKEKMFKRAFYEKEMHHVFVGTIEDYAKTLPNNRFNLVLINQITSKEQDRAINGLVE